MPLAAAACAAPISAIRCSWSLYQRHYLHYDYYCIIIASLQYCIIDYCIDYCIIASLYNYCIDIDYCIIIIVVIIIIILTSS